MKTLISTKDFLTSGFAIQWYLLLLLILITAMTVQMILFIRDKRFISLRFKLVYFVIGILFVSLSLLFVFQKPQLTSPKLPLFAPVSISPESPLTLVFDRPLDSDSTFKISPFAPGFWHRSHSFPGILFGNAVIFTPAKALEPGSEYTISIDNLTSFFGNDFTKSNSLLFVLKTSGENLAAEKSDDKKPEPVITDIKKPVFAEKLPPQPTLVPTTPVAQFKLNVPLIKQHNIFGCFSSAANMALGFYGVPSLGETGFMDKIGYDSTERNFATNTWGDPNQAVVGTLNGGGPGGYGVHWDPVARVLNEFRPTEVKRNLTVEQLLSEVGNNHPVLVWWVNGVWPAKDVSWNLPNGGKVYTVNGMHVEVVTGWKGSKDNPDLIYTNDPWRGYRAYPKATFESLWRWFDNTAVIVR